MGRRTAVLAAVVLIAAGSHADAADPGPINSSFEDDGWVKELRTQDPNGWDANLPAQGFRGYVYSDWATDGMYSLTLTADWFVTFAAGDTATVSQGVTLSGVERIVFDLKLQTIGYSPWDPDVCRPVVMIDDAVVWGPNPAQADIRGEYRGLEFVVDSAYRDGLPHRLALGLQVNATGMLFEKYVSQWDSIAFVPVCGGDILPGDLDWNCRVDMSDLTAMAASWLEYVDSLSPVNLSGIDDVEPVGIINFYDLAVLGGYWRRTSLPPQEAVGL